MLLWNNVENCVTQAYSVQYAWEPHKGTMGLHHAAQMLDLDNFTASTL